MLPVSPTSPCSATSLSDNGDRASTLRGASPPDVTAEFPAPLVKPNHPSSQLWFEDSLEPANGLVVEDDDGEYENPFSGWVMRPVRDERTNEIVGAKPVRAISPPAPNPGRHSALIALISLVVMAISWLIQIALFWMQ